MCYSCEKLRALVRTLNSYLIFIILDSAKTELSGMPIIDAISALVKSNLVLHNA